jgi:hypothetical protein
MQGLNTALIYSARILGAVKKFTGQCFVSRIEVQSGNLPDTSMASIAGAGKGRLK